MKNINLPFVRISMVRESPAKWRRTVSISSDSIAYRVLRHFFKDLDREHFLVCCLDAKNRINAVQVVSIGTLTMALVHPREVFKPAILSNSARIIVAHNHPSGDPTPSVEDILSNKRLIAAGNILWIDVLGSFVFGAGCYRRVAEHSKKKKGKK